jgi:hypothetical protein
VSRSIRVRSLPHVLRAGAFSGLASGALTATLALGIAWFRDVPLDRLVQVAAIPFLGLKVQDATFAAQVLVAGIAACALAAILWGMLFALVFWGLSELLTIAAGALYGPIVWFAMASVLLPVIGLRHIGTVVPLDVALVLHLSFGILLGGFFAKVQPVATNEGMMFGRRRIA